MRKKGTNRRGSIYQDKRGTWWAQLPPDDHGKRPKASARTEEEAVEKLKALEAKRAKRLNLQDARQTVEQLLSEWLDEFVAPTAKAKTLAGHRYVCAHYIVPHLGRIRLDQLGPLHIQRWLNALRSQGLSESTIQNAWTRLKTALNVALAARLIEENVLHNPTIKKPRSNAHEIDPLTVGQAGRLLDTVSGHRLEALYHVALALGLRRGELIGLRWTDINFARSEMHISSQLQRADGTLQRTTPKPGRTRVLPLDTGLVAILRAHWQNQQEERRLLGTAWKEHGLVFASEVGTPLSERSLDRQFQRALQRAKLPHKRLHDLRHTAATLMLSAGVPLIDVSKILGHASPEITARVYAHSLEEGRRRAVETVGRLLRREAP